MSFENVENGITGNPVGNARARETENVFCERETNRIRYYYHYYALLVLYYRKLVVATPSSDALLCRRIFFFFVYGFII